MQDRKPLVALRNPADFGRRMRLQSKGVQEDLRLFAITFAGGFLFMSLFIA